MLTQNGHVGDLKGFGHDLEIFGLNALRAGRRVRFTMP